MLLRAALLYAGPPALITGLPALQAHGLRRAPEADPHLLIANHRNVTSRAGVLMERTRRLPEPAVIDGLPTAPLARALVDAGRRIQRRGDVDGLVSEAVQRGLVDPGELLEEVRLAQVRGTAFVRAAARASLDGTHSGPEMDLRALLISAAVPAPLFNPDLIDAATGRFVARPDAYWHCGVAVEVDSRQHHTIGQDFDRTLARDALLTSYGILVLHVTPGQLRQQPRIFLDRLRRTLDLASTRPAPAVTVRRNSH
jgi:hypothetical protein